MSNRHYTPENPGEESIIYVVEPRVVAATYIGQHDAFLEAVDAMYEQSGGDITRVSNETWGSAFGLYWGVKRLMGQSLWSRWWKRVRAHIATPDPQVDALDAWAWFTRVMNWRREQARTQAGAGKRKWQDIKSDSEKHEAHKASNAAAQRRRRARPSEPTSVPATDPYFDRAEPQNGQAYADEAA